MPAADDIRRWSNELATDPQSLAFADLAEALRQQGDLETAERLAVRGLERHPTHGPALSVLARIAEARGDLNAASAYWERARIYNPTPTSGAANGSLPSPRTNGHANAPVTPTPRSTGAAYPTASYAAVPTFSASLATPDRWSLTPTVCCSPAPSRATTWPCWKRWPPRSPASATMRRGR